MAAAADTAPFHSQLRALAAAASSKADQSEVAARLAEVEESAAAALAELRRRVESSDRAASEARAATRSELQQVHGALCSVQSELERVAATQRAGQAELERLNEAQCELVARLNAGSQTGIDRTRDEHTTALSQRLHSLEAHTAKLAAALGSLEPRYESAVSALKDKFLRSLQRLRDELLAAIGPACADAVASIDFDARLERAEARWLALCRSVAYARPRAHPQRSAAEAREEASEARRGAALAQRPPQSEPDAALRDGLAALRVALGDLSLRVAHAEAGLAQPQAVSPAVLQALVSTLSGAHEAQAARLERIHTSLRSLVAALATDLSERPTKEVVLQLVAERARIV
jgi:hypothetical protein